MVRRRLPLLLLATCAFVAAGFADVSALSSVASVSAGRPVVVGAHVTTGAGLSAAKLGRARRVVTGGPPLLAASATAAGALFAVGVGVVMARLVRRDHLVRPSLRGPPLLPRNRTFPFLDLEVFSCNRLEPTS